MTPVASFTKEVNPQLAKGPLKTNGCLANRELTSLVNEATHVLVSCVARISAAMILNVHVFCWKLFRPFASFQCWKLRKMLRHLYVLTVNPAPIGLTESKISSEIVLSGPTLHRSFNKQPGTRQNAGVIRMDGIRSKIRCSTQCVHRSDICTGINFQQGPPVICEFSRNPHDAPNSDMVVDSQWDHYAIIPWMDNTHFKLIHLFGDLG